MANFFCKHFIKHNFVSLNFLNIPDRFCSLQFFPTILNSTCRFKLSQTDTKNGVQAGEKWVLEFNKVRGQSTVTAKLHKKL